MKKNILLLLFLFFSVINYGQRKEYKKAAKLFDAKNYSEATIIAEKILKDYPDDLDPNLKWHILNICADSNNFLKNYQKSIDYYTSLKKFATNGKVELTNKNEFLIDVDKVINELKNLLPVNNGTVINTSLEKQDNEINTIPTKSETDNNTVTLTVSGTGKTLEEAKLNALRSAIEQAFGAFISSKTEILNDNLIKDEIVSVASGNIQKFDIISEAQLANIGFTTTLKATVSIARLTSFVESKGVEVEFKGGLFARNIKIQKLNEVAELITIQNLCKSSFDILDNAFDFELKVNDPILKENSKDIYKVRFNVFIKSNNNYLNFVNYFISTIKSLSLSDTEVEDYKKINKEIFTFKIDNKKHYLRNVLSHKCLMNFFISSQILANTFKITSNIGIVKFSYSKIYSLFLDRGVLPFNSEYGKSILLKATYGEFVPYNYRSGTFGTSEKFLAPAFTHLTDKNKELTYDALFKFDYWKNEDSSINHYFFLGNNQVSYNEQISFYSTFEGINYSFDSFFSLLELEKINGFNLKKLALLDFIKEQKEIIEYETN